MGRVFGREWGMTGGFDGIEGQATISYAVNFCFRYRSSGNPTIYYLLNFRDWFCLNF